MFRRWKLLPEILLHCKDHVCRSEAKDDIYYDADIHGCEGRDVFGYVGRRGRDGWEGELYIGDVGWIGCGPGSVDESCVAQFELTVRFRNRVEKS